MDPYHGHSDESAQAESFASRLGTKHTTLRVTAGNFRALLPGFLKAAGQPYAVSSGLGIMSIAKEARSRGVKVLLSGDGADEAFGGYSWYRCVPASFSKQTSSQTAMRFIDGPGNEESRIKRMAGYDHTLRAWAWHYYASEEEKTSIFHHDVVKESSLRWFSSAQIEEPIDFIRNDRAFYFPNEMLSKVDRMTMAFSVEGRAPFAAPSVQKFSARLPWQMLIRDGQLKWALRQAFCRDLPADILWRPKHGFNVPIDHWLKGEWNDLFRETFSENSPLHRKGILAYGAYEYAHQLLHDPLKVSGHTLFAFVMLHLWMTEYEN
jgi:asparagine synthase (glutamine-hydrolysing)